MKDKALRSVVRQLNARLEYLKGELTVLKQPHPNDCKCDLCNAWKANPFVMANGYWREIIETERDC